jgi:LmbE family N-acetylglucosaminyl deacetylase
MLKLRIPKGQSSLKVLFLGAHSDDIEIGCGGTLMRMIREYPELEVTWVVFSALGERGEEAKKSAHEYLKHVEHKQIVVHDFKDGYFPFCGAEIKDIFEQLKLLVIPDVVFTHYRDDRHQDHRLLSDLTWNTWRDHFILEYEIPKYDGDIGSPNFFVSLDTDLCTEKVDLLMRFFQTQGNKHWFSPDTFTALLRLRGIECKSDGGYAEAFYCRKLTI